jgi:hypothetical protein
MVDYSSSTFILKAVLMPMTLLLLTTTDLSYDTSLYNASLQMILTLQASSTPASIQFFEIVSDICVSLGFVAIAITYIWASRARALYYMTLYCLMVFMMSTGKIAYHKPRPYMTDSAV